MWTMFSAEVVVAIGDEDLGAEQAVGAVGVALGARGDGGEIGAGLRLGQVHGAGPLALDHARQVAGFQLVGPVGMQRVDGALRQQRAEAEGEVGRVPDLAHRHGYRRRQVLAAILRGARQRAPASSGELLVGRSSSPGEVRRGRS